MEKHEKIITIIMNLKYHSQHGMRNLNYLMNHTLYQIFQIFLNVSLKNHEKKDVILSTMIINKIQEFYTHLFQINHLVVYQKFHKQVLLYILIIRKNIL